MTVRIVTTSREYDELGRLVKETVVEINPTSPDFVEVDSGQWWNPQPGWWQNPVVSCIAPQRPVGVMTNGGLS